MNVERPDVVAVPSGSDRGHRIPKARPRLGDLLALVAISAGVLALWRRAGPESIILSAPMLAFGIARRRGGRGVLATALTAMAVLFSYEMGFYAWWIFHPTPKQVDYIGPVFMPVIVAMFGLIYGALAGGLAWLLALGIEDARRSR